MTQVLAITTVDWSASRKASPLLARTLFYIAAVLAGAIGAWGDGLLNQWVKEGGTWWWIGGGFACWNIAGTMFLIMLTKGYLFAHSVAAFTAASDLLILYMAWAVFHEQLSVAGWIGVSFIVVGLVIAELGQSSTSAEV